MSLLKYPVTTQNGEYQVLVYKKYIACGVSSWNVDVQIFCKSLFSKFKTVYSSSLWEITFEKRYNHDYIAYAKDTVMTYENSIKENLEKELVIFNNIEAWNKWDGVINNTCNQIDIIVK
jgi:hypothetical protein